MTGQTHYLVLSAAGIGVVALLLYLITIYNSLVASRRYADREWANVDVLLKQRFDELPKLVELCRAYMQYEEGALVALTSARAAWKGARDVEAKASASRASTAGLRSLYAVAELYPALRANAQFVHLQKRLSELELQIADRREAYNEAVTNYNVRIAQWPDLLIARPFGFRPKPLFDTANPVTPEEEFASSGDLPRR